MKNSSAKNQPFSQKYFSNNFLIYWIFLNAEIFFVSITVLSKKTMPRPGIDSGTFRSSVQCSPVQRSPNWAQCNMQILFVYIPGILTAGIDPLGAIDPIAANSSKPAREPCDGNGCVLQLRKVSELSMEPNRSRDLYWSSEATEEEALKAATAATADIGGDLLFTEDEANWINSTPDPTSWTVVAESNASVLCRELKLKVLFPSCKVVNIRY